MPTDPVEIRRIRALRGPNVHAPVPVLQVTLDVGAYQQRPSTAFPGFADRLLEWLPGLRRQECSPGRPGGFVERLRLGTYLAHVVEHVACELQRLVGFDAGFGRCHPTGEPGVFTVVVAYLEEEPARAAVETALRLTLAAMHDEPFDVAAEIARLGEVADAYRLGMSTAAIVRAARRRGIPVLRLAARGELVQLGHGVHQKRVAASTTSLTAAVAVELCRMKSDTSRALRELGLPVPRWRLVSSAEEAWQAAKELRPPVVVKPEADSRGEGVSVGVATEAEVHAAYAAARACGRWVLVEQRIPGDDYRLLVVDGRMVAAARREPPAVVGDGQRTIAELVAAANRDPHRRPGHASTLAPLRLDAVADIVLAQQGLSRESVPTAGEVVRLRSGANVSTGASVTDVTDEVHPRNARLAELAARVLGLDIAGVDVVCADIARPLAEQGGAVVEVNAAPGLRMHLQPSRGRARDVAGPILDTLYPGGSNGRIPIVAVTGTNGKTTVTRLIGHMFQTARRVVGMTSTEGTYIGGERFMSGDCSGPKSAQAVLLHPRVEAAVLETARGGILREGLAFDSCTVGVVTNLAADHLGLDGVETLDDLARVKQVVVEAVAPGGAAVLNAANPRVAEMAAVCRGDVVYFALDPRQPVLAAHLAEGGRGVTVEDGVITLTTGRIGVPLIALPDVGFTAGGRIGFQVENALAAAGAAWGAGLNPAVIARALETFQSDVASNPGRFNVIEAAGRQVVIDYAHNAAALVALGQGLSTLGGRRTVALMGPPGDRRDVDLIDALRATLSYVDAYVFHDPNPRDREPGEVPQLLRSHLPDGVPHQTADSRADGIARAWAWTGPGDRLLLFADRPEEAAAFLERLVAEQQPTAPVESARQDTRFVSA